MIFFFSLTQYPTKKAYGVTLKGTYLAALESGYQAKIVSPSDLRSEKRMSRFLEIAMAVVRRGYAGIPIFLTKIAFMLHRALFCIYIYLEFSLKPGDIIWVRDLTFAAALSRIFPDNRIVLEIHQLQSEKNLRQIKHLSGKIVLSPISKAISQQIESVCNPAQVVYLPMGVSGHFFVADSPQAGFGEFNIGYFGSYNNSGYKQGIDSIISQLLPRFRLDPDFRILFAGLGPEGVGIMRNIAIELGVEGQIVLEEYIHHDFVPATMQKCQTLLLPYPEGDFFEGRFPLKALEYAASKRAIICTRTKSHTNLFTEEHVWFYKPEDDSGILNILDQIGTEKELAMHKIANAYNLACGYTYKHRIERIGKHLI
jgi:glycosyltransferase involved in cell wall biosynthesis